MNAWWSLTKKEFRLGFPAFLFALILFIGLFIGGYYMGRSFGFENEMVMSSVVTILLFHNLFLVLYMIYSLSYERKRLHLWLHNPMPIAGLLTSKLLSGLVFMTITFIPFITFAIFFQSNFDIFSGQEVFKIATFSTISIYSGAICIAIIFIFFWSIYLTLGKWMNEFFSFILTFILFILVITFYEYLMNSPFMIALTNWGPIEFQDIVTRFDFVFTEEEVKAGATWDSVLFYVGEYIVDLIATIFLFIAACWIIDRKVEV